ncbi:alpha/beta fold hydrolase [Parasedimentitalea huanghaiensis]|uniref:Alpha/beta fold hydrolase n=1 Tax=Parasedimentitalea huanghaiensis TaxID=2682100 RepID=A0A6L6WJL4_9RHOB|nr:alpha/beta fold hydrolase [Zongyanglinia huanghaiensis]MVO18006.1 alpha/beta fold hydrolase [Zongyanglinia huanghaiensis]
MARETVHRIGSSSARPADIWAFVQDFSAPWHPLVEWMEREQRKDAQVIRRFGVKGDTAIVRERLTYLSNSDHVMAYVALEGIADAQKYAARLKISPSETGSTLTWHADIEAAAPRVKEIAAGTEQVFDAGITVLSKPPEPKNSPTDRLPSCAIGTKSIGQTPRLAMSIAPKGLQHEKTICLFLHGIGGNRSNWDAQLAALGNTMPVVSLDLRGYGDSTLGFEQSKTDDYFEDILSVMDAFNAEKLVLCGLSYGSWIATSFALQHPEKLAGLILCGGCTGMSEADPDEREAFRVSREVPLNAGQSPSDFAVPVVDAISGPNATQEVRQTLRESMATIPSATYRDALTCFTNPLEKLDFSKASFPVLLMTGEFDRLAPPAEIRQISHRFFDAGAPFVQFEVIADAGHVCNLEQPMEVNHHIKSFLDMVGPMNKQPNNTRSEKKAAKRKRILDAALIEFSRNGYSGASMQAIAERAEVSKPTLYQYIGQKDDIFRAILEAGRAKILAAFENTDEQDLTFVLWEFSWQYADYVLHPDNLSIARLMIGEALRVPDIVSSFNETGPAKAQAGVAAYLETQRNAGHLIFEDSWLAAEHLWALILSGPRNAALHFPNNLPSDQDLLPVILGGLKAFLRAYSSNLETDIEKLDALGVQRPLRRS